MTDNEREIRRAELLVFAFVYLLAVLLAVLLVQLLPNLFDTPLPEWRSR